MSSESLDRAREIYQTGRYAFERGQYRQSVQDLEKASALVKRNTAFGGEVQIWLVMAYQALGQPQAAIDLCRTLCQHPDLEIRQQSRRLLYILEAPKLETRPEWLSQIPDLSSLEDSGPEFKRGENRRKPSKPAPPRFQVASEPIDPSQINTKDNQFIWVALVGAMLTLGSLIWLGL
jgi:tetratricopeptide (TPR) repeat protein